MKRNSPLNQLVLNLGHRTGFERSDLFVSECNVNAVKWLERWPDWPSLGLVIWGPEASGKSHLGKVWCDKSDSALLFPDDFDLNEPPDIVKNNKNILIDGAELIIENSKRERSLLHVYNLINERRGHMLFCARTPPGRWGIKLADLSSRLNSLPVTKIALPDDKVLAAVLLKLFTDRQLKVEKGVIDFAISRMERSFRAADELASIVDKIALVMRRPVTIPLLSEVFSEIEKNKLERES